MILVTILANGLESFFSRHTPRVICGAINAFHLTLFSDSLRIMRKNVSIDEPLVKKWDVTGDDGTSRFSLILLRIMTTAFFLLTSCFLLIVLDVFNVSSGTIRLQVIQIVGVIALCFVALGLGVALSLHPLMGARSKALLLGLFWFGVLGSYQYALAEKLNVSPFLIVPGLPLAIASLAFIPLTYAAWTARPTN